MKRHFGKLKSTGEGVIVVMMQLPENPKRPGHYALVVNYTKVNPLYKDDLNGLVESPEAQAKVDLADVLARNKIQLLGKTYLQELHEGRYLKTVPAEDVLMIPQPNMAFPLIDLINSGNLHVNTYDTKQRLQQNPVTQPLNKPIVQQPLIENVENIADVPESLIKPFAPIPQVPVPPPPFGVPVALDANLLNNNLNNLVNVSKPVTLSETSEQMAVRLLAEVANLRKEANAREAAAYALNPSLRPTLDGAVVTKTPKKGRPKKVAVEN